MEFYHKNQVHGSYHAPSNMLYKIAIILTFQYLHMEPEASLIFKIKSSLANLNSGTKFERFLHIKLLGNGI